MPEAPKKWTVMVYMAGDNNLDAAGLVDLKEMKQVGSTTKVNVVVQFDNGVSHTTKRYFIRKGGKVEKDVVGAPLGRTNTGDPAVLEGFVRWAMQKYPAEHYMLVLWNHGAGWDDENVYRTAKRIGLSVRRRGTEVSTGAKGAVSFRRVRVLGGKKFRRALFDTGIKQGLKLRGIAYDDNARDFLDNLELKKVLASVTQTLGRKIDVLGMDACLMSMAEVVYQLRDSVGVSVGSEETEPGDGWPYDTLLKALTARPTMSAKQLGATVVQKYLASYAAEDGVTQSCCDLGQLATLTQAIDGLGKALTAALPTLRGAITDARLQAQSYETEDYIDLCDFARLLQAGCNDPQVHAACAALIDAVTGSGFVIRSGHKGGGVQHSHGVSIYFPLKTVSKLYATLDFAKQTSWAGFLEAFVSQTRRPGVLRAAAGS